VTGVVTGMGLGPLAALGAGAVLAMLLAPRAEARAVRAVGAFWIGFALLLALTQRAAPVPQLMAGDPLARLGLVLAGLAGLAALAILRPTPPAKEAPALILLATLGAGVLAGASHAATLFLGLEMVTLALIALIALPRTGPALEAAYKFLILGGIGAATLLFGLALGYAATGALDLAGWGARGLTVSLGAALLLAGLAFKFALVPFHMWTPDVFSGAPAVAALLAGVASKVGVAVVLVRLDAAGPPDPAWQTGLALVGAASVILGNLQALRQTALARMLGYSSIGHSGYLALILAAGAPVSAEAALVAIAAYAPALIAALAVAALLGGRPEVTDLPGLLTRQPLAGAALVLALVSLAGLPASVGFVAKFYLFTALIQTGAWVLLAVALAGSAFGLAYYLRFAVAACRAQDPEAAAPARATWADDAVFAVTAAAIAGLGVMPGPLTLLVRAALP
jgi:NADH-quinone oxidoreductase subunit N